MTVLPRAHTSFADCSLLGQQALFDLDPDLATVPPAAHGVHSAVGRLHKVLVCRPGLAHRRLTPTSSDELLFDDILWVDKAVEDHDAFTSELTRHGVDVIELHYALAHTLRQPAARDWVLDRTITPEILWTGLADAARAYLEQLSPERLAELLIGGLATEDLPDLPAGYHSLAAHSSGTGEYLLRPVPNTLYARDAATWVYSGVTLNPLSSPARHHETLLMKAVHTFHPDFVGTRVWWGDPETDHGNATLEGGDIVPVGNGTVLMSISGRTSGQAITQVSSALFAADAATSVVVAGMPKLRSAARLDTILAFVDIDTVAAYPGVVDSIQPFVLRPTDSPVGLDITDEGNTPFLDVLAREMGLGHLRVIETDGDASGPRHQRWSSSDALAIEPGVVLTYDRSTTTNDRLRKAGIEVIEIPGGELSRNRGGIHRLASPVVREPVL